MLLPSAHQPTLEGLRHGGLAALSRRRHSGFGSGWRGIYSLPHDPIFKFTDTGAFVLSHPETYMIFGHQMYNRMQKSTDPSMVNNYKKFLNNLAQGIDYHQRTGIPPVIINPYTPGPLKVHIRHERLHGIDFNSATETQHHPAIQEIIEREGPLSKAVTKDALLGGSSRVRAEELGIELQEAYESRYGPEGKPAIDSEIFTFSQQRNKNIRKKLAQKGVDVSIHPQQEARKTTFETFRKQIEAPPDQDYVLLDFKSMEENQEASNKEEARRQEAKERRAREDIENARIDAENKEIYAKARQNRENEKKIFEERLKAARSQPLVRPEAKAASFVPAPEAAVAPLVQAGSAAAKVDMAAKSGGLWNRLKKLGSRQMSRAL